MSELTGATAKFCIGGTPIQVTGGATTTTDNKTYKIADVSKEIMSPDHPIIVLDGGVPTEEDYKTEKLNGKIIFETEDEDRVITVTYKYIPVTQYAEAYSCSVNKTNELAETTRFGDTHKRRMVVSKDVEIEMSHYDVLDTYFSDDFLEMLYMSEYITQIRFI